MTTKQIQALLTYLGYDPGEVDGLPGNNTRRAVQAFQAQEGLEQDGSPGPLTQAALLDAVAAGRFREEDAPTPDDATGTFWDHIQYFKREEFRCKCGGKYCNGFPVEPEEKMVRAVDEIRRRLGIPVSIGSGVRCQKHNAAVGGVSNSQHPLGKAADLHSAASPAKMKEVAEEVMGNTGGIGLYDWGIHVDTREVYARWNG